MKFLSYGALVAAIFTVSVINTPAQAQYAAQLSPVFIDRSQGFTYFLVKNRWGHTVSNLWGRVFGFGSPDIPGAYLLNNPHSEGMKVSLGRHYPGSVAMYRFQTPSEWMFFPSFALMINDNSLYHPMAEAR